MHCRNLTVGDRILSEALASDCLLVARQTVTNHDEPWQEIQKTKLKSWALSENAVTDRDTVSGYVPKIVGIYRRSIGRKNRRKCMQESWSDRSQHCRSCVECHTKW